jgi:hypothetical protein
MRLAQWLASFKALHQKAKQAGLSQAERGTYLAARDELARALLAAQRAQAKPGESPRQVLRVSRALQADLERNGERIRALTLDLSVGGFGALLARIPTMGEKVKATLRLPGGELVSGPARVVGAVQQGGSSRVAFAFDPLPAADQEKLELVVFDTVLDQMKLEPEKK